MATRTITTAIHRRRMRYYYGSTMPKTSRENAPHYRWGQGCDGWRLADEPGLSVIEERMPPGTSEVRHHHERARQYFRVLDGEAMLECGGERHMLRAGEGLEVPPGTPHRLSNESAIDLRFLVISAPTTRGDRVEDSGGVKSAR